MVCKEDKEIRKRLKVLVVAASVHPLKGSEPGMGWNWLLALSKYHDIWAIVGGRESNREAIDDYFNRYPEQMYRLKIHYIPRPNPPWPAKVWPPLYYRYYKQWHRQALRVAKRLSKDIQFDLTHQLNMIGYREPGYLWKLPLPFIWGPISGYGQMLWSFLSIIGVKDVCFYTCRNLINAYQMRANIRVKRAMRCATTVIAATGKDLAAIQRFHGKDAVLIAETGASLSMHSDDGLRIRSNSPIKICWCGLLIGRKALPLALHAVAKVCRETALELNIVGDGPERKRWRKLASKLGVDRLCHWHGWVPHHKVLDVIRASDLMLITSIGDSTTTVVFEALSCGKPVVCHESFGFSDVINSSCGIKIPLCNPRTSVDGFAEAIGELGANPERLASLSNGAIQRIQAFTWDRKAREVSELYHCAMSRGKHSCK